MKELKLIPIQTLIIEKHEEAKNGETPPVFPANIDNLNKIYKKPTKNKTLLLNEAAKSVDGYLGEIENFKTSDGYEWEKAYEFELGKAKIIAAFPQLNDQGRSIALYVTGEPGKWTAHVLAAHLSRTLQNFQRRQG